MKIAWCFYGLPKKLENGFDNINNYINKYSLDVDFFCHAWYCGESEYNIQSPWAIKRDGNIRITIEHLNNIKKLYKPKNFLFEKQKSMNEEIDFLKNTIIYNNNPHNIYNALSVCYSTQNAIMLLNDYISKNNCKYDFVIVSRYDFLKPIKLNLNDIDITNKFIYSTDIHFKTNRNLLSPALLCGEYDIMNKLLNNIFTNIFLYKNDNSLNTYIQNNFKENMKLNHEEIILCNLIYNKININCVKFTNLIPNFI